MVFGAVTRGRETIAAARVFTVFVTNLVAVFAIRVPNLSGAVLEAVADPRHVRYYVGSLDDPEYF